MEANGENATSKWNLYLSLALIFFVLAFVAPLLLFINVRTTLAADVFIKNLTIRTEKIVREQKRSEKLVTKLLPTVVIERLKEKKEVAFTYDAATVMFCSLYGFTDVIKNYEAMQSFKLLNSIYHVLDKTISYFDVYKVETINDKYMVVSGVPTPNGNRHADEIARLSLAFMKKMQEMRDESSRFPDISARIGIHSGNTVAGVVGNKMPRFCLFGETINLASRMETNGGPAKIQISSTTKTLLDLTEASSFATKARGPVDIKGIGIMETFWLLGRKSDRDMDDLDDIDYE